MFTISKSDPKSAKKQLSPTMFVHWRITALKESLPRLCFLTIDTVAIAYAGARTVSTVLARIQVRAKHAIS